MATRSMIGIENANGTVTGIYCHWDGYPSHVGAILKAHYTTEERVRALLEPGDLSSIDEDIGEKHDFDRRPPGVCNYYGRDRGEPDVDQCDYASRESFVVAGSERWAEYFYLFSGGEWLMRSHNDAFAPFTITAD